MTKFLPIIGATTVGAVIMWLLGPRARSGPPPHSPLEPKEA